MDLAKLMDEISDAVKSVDGINQSYAYPPEKIEPPASLVGWPDVVTYDQTYAGGMDQYEIPVYVVMGRSATLKSKRNRIAKWLQGDVKNAIEQATYTGNPVVKVQTAVTDDIEVAGINYLATEYRLMVSGTGSR